MEKEPLADFNPPEPDGKYASVHVCLVLAVCRTPAVLPAHRDSRWLGWGVAQGHNLIPNLHLVWTAPGSLAGQLLRASLPRSLAGGIFPEHLRVVRAAGAGGEPRTPRLPPLHGASVLGGETSRSPQPTAVRNFGETKRGAPRPAPAAGKSPTTPRPRVAPGRVARSSPRPSLGAGAAGRVSRGSPRLRAGPPTGCRETAQPGRGGSRLSERRGGSRPPQPW